MKLGVIFDFQAAIFFLLSKRLMSAYTKLIGIHWWHGKSSFPSSATSRNPLPLAATMTFLNANASHNTPLSVAVT